MDINSSFNVISDDLLDLLVSLNMHPAHSLGSQSRLLESESKCQGSVSFDHLMTSNCIP